VRQHHRARSGVSLVSPRRVRLGARPTAPKWSARTRRRGMRRPRMQRWQRADYRARHKGDRPKRSCPMRTQRMRRRIALETAEDYGRADLALAPLNRRVPVTTESADLRLQPGAETWSAPHAIVNALPGPRAFPGDTMPHVLLATAHALLSRKGRPPRPCAPRAAEQKLEIIPRVAVPGATPVRAGAYPRRSARGTRQGTARRRRLAEEARGCGTSSIPSDPAALPSSASPIT